MRVTGKAGTPTPTWVCLVAKPVLFTSPCTQRWGVTCPKRGGGSVTELLTASPTLSQPRQMLVPPASARSQKERRVSAQLSRSTDTAGVALSHLKAEAPQVSSQAETRAHSSWQPRWVTPGSLRHGRALWPRCGALSPKERC